ncbi:Polyol transporter 5 [Linum perenne]
MFDSVNSIAGDMHLTGLQPHLLVEVMSRVPNFGGACVAGVAANFYGRAYTAGFGTALYTVGVLVVSISRNYVACAVGHSIAGFGIGMGLVVGPIYIAEIAPANVRSFLGYTPQVINRLKFTINPPLQDLLPMTDWKKLVNQKLTVTYNLSIS